MLLRDVPFFGVPFLKMNFGVSFLADSQIEHKILGCQFRIITLQGIDFDQISLTWLKFWIVVTILGYTISVACTF